MKSIQMKRFLALLTVVTIFSFVQHSLYAQTEPADLDEEVDDIEEIDTSTLENSSGNEELNESSEVSMNEVQNDSESVLDVSGTTTATTSESEIDTSSNESTGTSTQATSTDTDAVHIETGDATAVSQIINIVNSNFFNSRGLFLFLNNLFGNVGTLDLRDLPIFSNDDSNDVSACTTLDCSSELDVTIQNSNSAIIENNVVVRANTGSNTVSSDSSSVSVSTGDSFAVADIVNVANTNITEGGYLLLVFNNFGDWVGDLVFPAANLFSTLFTGESLTVSNTNTATVENDIHVEADSGSNSATGTPSSISTGNTSSSVNVVNNLNQNLIGNDAFAVVFRFHGDWAGEIFNAPSGLVWQENDGVLELFLAPGSANSTPNGVNASDLSIDNTNTAHISNNVEVYALTGDNEAHSSVGSADVSTGNAQASANILNVANTNVVGRNMLFAIINIFGDWTGNVSFGRPDLWIGGWAEFDDDNLRPGSNVTYHLTVANKGDAPASNVDVSLDIRESGFLSMSRKNWSFDELLPGDSETISVRATVLEMEEHNKELTTIARVAANEPDNKLDDNSEEIVVTLNQLRVGTALAPRKSPDGEVAGAAIEMPNILMERSRSPSEVATIPGKVEYKISIRNESDGPAYQSVLVDVLRDPNGEIVHREEWVLGTILPHEEIMISYTASFAEDSLPGTYTSEAQVLAVGQYDDLELGSQANSSLYKLDTELQSGARVMSVDQFSCPPFVQSFIKPGDTNHVIDVVKLQLFLRNYEGMSSVPLSGRYDDSTVEAVIRFQEKYGSDVLAPWGLNSGNGNVLSTTRGKINGLVCRPFQVTG